MKATETKPEGTIVNASRRRFLQGTLAAGAGLTLGVVMPRRALGQEQTDAAFSNGNFEPNAFVRVGTDDTVTVVVKHLEMGQGTYTGLPTLVAEELDADWSQVRAEGAPADASKYNNLNWGPMQGTGGSSAIANSYMQMRKAGAAARQMLVQAAADAWGVPAGEITVEVGRIRHGASGNESGFGAFAERAASLPVPADPPVKSPADFRLIGKGVPRKDTAEKTNGKAIFTQDIKLPDMLTAVVAHPPRFGAKVKTFDAAAAKKVKGVMDVVQIPTGIAVLARDFYSADQGRKALTVEWDETGAMTLGSDDLMAQYRELAGRPGKVVRADGDALAALDGASNVIAADYEFPYLAHAAMEPMNCVMQLTREGCTVYNGEQFQTVDQQMIASALGLEPAQVKLNMLYAGGSFGRRANPDSDYLLEAASIVKATDGKRPIKLVWSREDDMTLGYYRPMYFHRLRALLGDDGMPSAWHHRIVGQSILSGTPMAGMVRDGIDPTSVEGASNLPYAIADLGVELHTTETGVPVQWWRSVGSTHTAFSTETFIDELAARAGQDAVDYRMKLLADHPRHRGVLELAAEKGGWGGSPGEGRGRGIAVHESFNSYVAQVADVSVKDDGSYTVDKVVIAVDCGVAVNPDVVRAQMEGGMGYGLSAALSSEITLEEGRVEQTNFHNYQVLRIDQMPEVEVHIVSSGEAPTGVGEPGTPVIAPAVAGALHAATGQRLYRLPLRLKA